MNSDYERVIIWGDYRLEQVEPRHDELVRYETMWSQVVLWQWKSRQWGAKFDNNMYSIAISWDEALLSAARKAIDAHYYSIAKIKSAIENEVWESFD